MSYSAFEASGGHRMRSVQPDLGTLSQHVHVASGFDINVLSFSLQRNDNSVDRYDKHRNVIADVTNARVEHKFIKSIRKLHRLVNDIPKVR